MSSFSTHRAVLAAALAVWALSLPAQPWRARGGLEVIRSTAQDSELRLATPQRRPRPRRRGDAAVYDQRPNDTTFLIRALKTHEAVLGRTPRLVAADAGFYSAKNEAAQTL